LYRCILALLLLTPQETVERTFLLDFSTGDGRSNMEVETRALGQLPQDRTFVIFSKAGESRLTTTFVLPMAPEQAVLELEHLSSSSDVRFGGNSRIDVHINGSPLVREWEVGTLSFLADRLAVTKLIRPGKNTLELRFAGGDTVYWLRRLKLECRFPAGTSFDQGVQRIAGGADYAVVVSRETFADLEWGQAARTLAERRDATILVHSGPVEVVKAALAEQFPRHVAFVARPEEVSRPFVISVHRLTRALDDDPYTDVFWGIVTGYEAGDVVTLANDPGPLTVRRAAAGCGLDLTLFEQGRLYSETQQGVWFERKPHGEVEQRSCPPDTTERIVKTLNDWRPDYFATSGHATSRDWQIGYSYPNGQFRCRDGRVIGLDLQGHVFAVNSPNPKVYGPAGNCLMGLVEDRNSMAPAWIHSVGVRQMIGFVVSTWYGYGGHGVNQIFIEQQGRFTFAEAFRANNVALVHRLSSRYPEAAGLSFDDFGIESNPRLLNQLAAQHGLPDRDALGLLWDRDTVAFYGDPAYQARVERVVEPAWNQTLEEDRGRFTFTVTATRGGTFHRPPLAFLPYRVTDVLVLEGADLAPLITDDLVLLPKDGEFEQGETFRIVFRAKRR